MNRGQRILTGTIVGLVLAGLWLVPLLRALRLLSYTLDTLVDIHSVETENDVRYAFMLVASYALCVLCNFVFGVWVALRPQPWLVIPGLVLFYAPIDVIQINPEHVITLFPLMNPGRPLLFCLVVLVVVFVFRRRWKEANLT